MLMSRYEVHPLPGQYQEEPTWVLLDTETEEWIWPAMSSKEACEFQASIMNVADDQLKFAADGWRSRVSSNG
jgi:hypothetical protein